MKTILLAALLSGCAFNAETLRLQERAGVRRQAGSSLHACLRSPPYRPFNEKSCVAESKTYCRSRGLEETCGIENLWTNEYDAYGRQIF